MKAGDTVVVYAAAGGTGSLLSQWAAALGARVIGMISSQQKAYFARRCGAAEVVVTQEGDLVGKVKALTGEQGADIVFDAIGNDSFAQSLAMLGQRGHLVSYGQASGAVGMRDIDALTGKSARLSRPNFFDYAGTQEQLKRHSDALFTMISDGKLSVNISARLALAEARKAHQILEGRTNCGSVVLTV